MYFIKSINYTYNNSKYHKEQWKAVSVITMCDMLLKTSTLNKIMLWALNTKPYFDAMM